MTSPAAKEFAALGAKTVSVDYDNHASLVEALKGVEVVISTLAGPGFGSQLPLAKASKEAGVQLFVPRYVFMWLAWVEKETKVANGGTLAQELISACSFLHLIFGPTLVAWYLRCFVGVFACARMGQTASTETTRPSLPRATLCTARLLSSTSLRRSASRCCCCSTGSLQTG